MKVLLISPPFYRILGFYNRYFPFGVTLIGTVVKKAGHKTLVYDADCFTDPKSIDYSQLPEKYPQYLNSFNDPNHPVWQEVRNTIKKFKPDVIGISAFTTYAASAFYTAKICKELFPKVPVILGGPHATTKSEEVLTICPYIDFVVRGEGEKTIIELLNYFSKKRIQLKSILGISYRKNKQIIHHPNRPRTNNLDEFPLPNRSILLNEKKYSSEDMGLIMTSRGCPYNCTYCASTKGISYRSIKSVLQEITSIKNKYHTTQFTFKDDSFTVDFNRVKNLCNELIKRNLNIKWECNTRVNLITPELLSTMKKAGCNFIKVGIESGSAPILKKMNKGISLDQSRKAAIILRNSKIHWTGYFLMGLIDETIKDIRKTVAFMKELKPDLALIGVYEPFPGTAMYIEGIKKGLVKENMTLNDFFTTNPNDYYKKNPKIQSNIISPKKFKKLENEVKDIFRQYNLKLNNVISMGLSKILVYIKDPLDLAHDLDKFFKYYFK